uniref:Uncharacterized protein n=1 Tax=Arundo donax TaxID=35708 RepID=A0A0A8ZP13_ARUDO
MRVLLAVLYQTNMRPSELMRSDFLF